MFGDCPSDVRKSLSDLLLSVSRTFCLTLSPLHSCPYSLFLSLSVQLFLFVHLSLAMGLSVRSRIVMSSLHTLYGLSFVPKPNRFVVLLHLSDSD